jgi:hypothetical protein
MISRRRFTQGLVTLAFAGLSRHLLASPSGAIPSSSLIAYGKLLNDPNALIDLPAGFSYSVISSLNEKMADGLPVPDRADGMGCFYLDDERVVLIRNHELSPKDKTIIIDYSKLNISLCHLLVPFGIVLVVLHHGILG